MAVSITREQVQTMAPDAASAKAGASLSNQSKWVSIGANAQSLWGECKGSGKKPYQTQVELGSYTSRCSCPSRKFPCKHALGLLYLYADQAAPLTNNSEAPQWVTEWLEGRKERAAKKEERAEKQAQAKAADPEKQAAQIVKRQKARWKNIQAGAQELQLWLVDQFQQGFASFSSAHTEQWRNMAARMVDAQAPGLGRMLQNALDTMESGTHYEQDAIAQLGMIQLLVSATLRQEELPPAIQADVRAALGWAMDKEEILALPQDQVATVTDQWLVLGQTTEEADSRLTERRIWLYGTQTHQYALLLDFAYKGQGLDWSWNSQFCYEATLSYYPSAAPLRALVIEQNAQPQETPWPVTSVKETFERAASQFAATPWLVRIPLLIPEAMLISKEDEWFIQTPEGLYSAKIHDNEGWGLMAFSGGLPMNIFAEWDGSKLNLLSACLSDQSNQAAKEPSYWLQTQRVVTA